MKAIWKNEILAESNKTIVIENNHYFPLSSINKKHFVKSETKTICPWKGTARYYNISIAGETNIDAAWYYPEPKEAAINIKNYIAFWKDAVVTN